MSFTIYNLASGHIDKIVGCPEDFLHLQYDPEVQGYLEGSFDDTLYYVEDGAPVRMPERPSPVHVFDYATRTWVDGRSLDQVKSRKLVDIDAERLRRTVLPIAYDGATLDADKTAQDNISGKLQEIAMRLGMGIQMAPELMVWRDYDNNNRTFASLADYQTWLGGLAIAITERGTLLYGWAWQMKAAVLAAQSIAEVDALDLGVA